MRICAQLLVISLVAGAAASARAEDPKKAAKKHLEAGDKYFKKGNYEGALEEYKAAFDAFPSAKIYYPMALTEEKLGRDVDAYNHYELLTTEAGDPIPDALKADAQARMAEIEKRLVVIKFDVRPLGSTITVDNVELGQSPLDKPVRLMPGNHAWSITKDGFMPVEKEMELSAGTALDEVVQLEKEAPAVAVTTTPKKKPRRSGSAGASERKVVIGGLVVTSAFTAAAVVTGLIAVSKHGQFTDTDRTLDERAAARDTGKAMAVTTDVLLLGATAAGIFTTYWYYKKYKPAVAAGRGEKATVLAPYVSPDGAGLAVMGRF